MPGDNEWADCHHRLNAGFDPLEFDRFTRFQELTRMMAESVNDVGTVQQNLQQACTKCGACRESCKFDAIIVR